MTVDDATAERIRSVLARLDLDEDQVRGYLAIEAQPLGHGGAAAVARAAGVSAKTVRRGLSELEGADVEPPKRRKKGGRRRVRRRGGGRKPVSETDPDLEPAIRAVVDEHTYGDPMSSKVYVNKGIRYIARRVSKTLGRKVSHETVRRALKRMGYSLKGNKKCLQVGKAHPDRDAQFKHIAARIDWYTSQGLPVLSIDTKKKENLGQLANVGREWAGLGACVKVLDHDFPDREKGKAIPHGVYDVRLNLAFVLLGCSRDTAQFACHSLQRWLDTLGRANYGDFTKMLITCDGGGSNGVRSRLWRRELQNFADRNGIQVEICHYPPGTSKFNKIERRLFSHITRTWRAVPLTSLELVRHLVASTTTSTGLRVTCEIDRTEYERGIKVSDAEIDSLDIVRNDFHGEWNYLVRVRPMLDLASAGLPVAA